MLQPIMWEHPGANVYTPAKTEQQTLYSILTAVKWNVGVLSRLLYKVKTPSSFRN